MSEYEDFDLDGDMAEVKDLVSFTNPPNGTHVYGCVFCGPDTMGKGDKKQACIRIIYQKISTEEKAKEGDLDAANGSVFSENFGNNEDGKKFLKARLKGMFGEEISGSFRPYLDTLQSKKMSEFMFRMTTSINITKNDGQTYENVRIKATETIKPIELPEGFEQFEYSVDKDE